MSKGKGTIQHIGETSLLFATGVAFHCLSNPSTSIEQEAALFGLSSHLVTGAFTLAGHVVAHGVYKGWAQTKENFKSDNNYHLENAIINAYQNTFKELEDEIIEKYNLKEEITSKLFRVFFDKENNNHEDLTDLRENFLIPLLKFLTDNKAIEEMLSKDDNLQPDDYLIKIIEKVTPEYYPNDQGELKEFVTTISTRFKILFKHHFVKELKKEDKAKTVYFTHLLEGITLDLKKFMPTINELCIKLEISLPTILSELQIIKTEVKKYGEESISGVNLLLKRFEELKEEINISISKPDQNFADKARIKKLQIEFELNKKWIEIYEIKNLEEQDISFDNLVTEYDNAPMLTLVSADLAEQRGQNKRAKKLYESYLRNNEDDSRAHSNYAILLMTHFEEMENAKNHFEESLRINPQNIYAINSYANLLKNHFKDYEASRKYFEEALQINPNLSMLHNNYGLLLTNHFHEFENAEQHYQKALILNPKSSSALFNYADLLMLDLKRYEEARKYYEEGFKIDPNSAEAYINAGVLLMNQFSEYKGAKKYFEKAMQLSPLSFNSHFNYAILLAAQFHNYEDARNHYEKALSINPNSANANYFLAELLALIFNDKEKAKHYYNEAIQLQPSIKDLELEKQIE